MAEAPARPAAVAVRQHGCSQAEGERDVPSGVRRPPGAAAAVTAAAVTGSEPTATGDPATSS